MGCRGSTDRPRHRKPVGGWGSSPMSTVGCPLGPVICGPRPQARIAHGLPRHVDRVHLAQLLKSHRLARTFPSKSAEGGAIPFDYGIHGL